MKVSTNANPAEVDDLTVCDSLVGISLDFLAISKLQVSREILNKLLAFRWRHLVPIGCQYALGDTKKIETISNDRGDILPSRFAIEGSILEYDNNAFHSLLNALHGGWMFGRSNSNIEDDAC